MRLDKFIGQATDLTRRQIHILIKQGVVKVNNEIVSSAAMHLDANDHVALENAILIAPQTRYLMLHKPTGYVCANTDSEHPTVLDLLDISRKATLQIVGRLDIDTTGLVLLTDDGQWNHRLTSPRSHCAKTYHLTTAEPIQPTTMHLFAEGVQLHGEKKPTLPSQLEMLGPCEARLTLNEGKYHQVKRMFAATGNRVITLHRERIGQIHLDPELSAGQCRALTPEEIASVSYA